METIFKQRANGTWEYVLWLRDESRRLYLSENEAQHLAASGEYRIVTDRS